MEFVEDNGIGYRITGSDSSTVYVNEVAYTENTAITGESVISPWRAAPDGPLCADDFALCQTQSLDIILVATGETYQPLPPQIMAYLHEQGIGAESMNTAAACRTYNILLAEARRVGLFLLGSKP